MFFCDRRENPTAGSNWVCSLSNSWQMSQKNAAPLTGLTRYALAVSRKVVRLATTKGPRSFDQSGRRSSTRPTPWTRHRTKMKSGFTKWFKMTYKSE